FSLGTLREFLTTDDPIVAESIREDIFVNLKGITTCTQFGVATVLLGLWLYFRGERRVVGAIGLVLALAMVRALLFSERLALLELIIPAMVFALRARVLGRPLRRVSRVALRVAPLAGIVTLL